MFTFSYVMLKRIKFFFLATSIWTQCTMQLTLSKPQLLEPCMGRNFQALSCPTSFKKISGSLQARLKMIFPETKRRINEEMNKCTKGTWNHRDSTNNCKSTCRRAFTLSNSSIDSTKIPGFILICLSQSPRAHWRSKIRRHIW